MKFGMWSMVVLGLTTACAMSPAGEDANGSKEDLTATASVTDGTLACNAATSVEVAISGTNVTSITPVDLMLVVDESGSINSTQFATLKNFLVNVVEGLDTLFKNGGKVGVDMFSNQARLIVPLSTNKTQIMSGIKAVQQVSGLTCIGCGIDTAMREFGTGSSSGRKKVMIVLTDGMNNPPAGTSSSLDFTQQVTKAQQAGVTLMAVGVGSQIDPAQLQFIATGSGNQNVFGVSDFDGLRTILQQLIAAVVTPEATNAKLVLDVNTAFAVSNPTVDYGSVTQSGNQLRWAIPKIQDSTVKLSYRVAHLPVRLAGQKPIHAKVVYTDDQGNQLSLPDVNVTIYGCDQDSDGIVDEQDNCPALPNSDQADFDADGLGDACDPDDDADGALDEQDGCQETPLGASPIDENGCTLGQLCPCDEGNHGAYVSCIQEQSKLFQSADLFDQKQRAAAIKDAAGGACIE